MQVRTIEGFTYESDDLSDAEAVATAMNFAGKSHFRMVCDGDLVFFNPRHIIYISISE